MVKKIIFALTLIFIGLSSASIYAQTKANSDVVLVLPFENISNRPEFNWVGESFARSLTDLLKVPGLNVVSNSQRKIVQQRLRIPLTSLPSLATSLKLARESGATLLIAGKYNIIPADGDLAATVNVTAKIIRVNEGRFLNEELPDGRRVTRDMALNDALGNLQTMQGQIAYQILYQRDKALPYSQNEKIGEATKIPALAFEAYIKGLLTPTNDVRENYFKNAVRLYGEADSEGVFSDAALELGHLYLGQRKFSDAIASFEPVVNAGQQCREKAKNESRPLQCDDESFAEASFYIGLIQWQQGNYEQALGVLRPLAEDLKLTTVYNTLGAIAVQAAREEKKNPAKAAALMNEGTDLLKKAAASSPDDANVRFNYGLSGFLSENYPQAIEQLKPLVALNPGDGESYYILSKSLAAVQDETAVEYDNQARKYLTANNKYATLEKEWMKSKSIVDIQLRVEQPQRRDFLSVVLSSKSSSPTQKTLNDTDELLKKAREQFKNGNDDEALASLRRVLASEPMNAESYLILGKIHLRRGDIDPAISSFRTALFWDSRLIDANIALGKIYFEKKVCLEVKNYSIAALDIDPENPDAIALQRQSERCSK